MAASRITKVIRNTRRGTTGKSHAPPSKSLDLRGPVRGPGLRACHGRIRGAVPDMSLEELLNTEVTSASRKAQSQQSVAAAVFVITREDIARSGARNLPDLLAMAPGIEVARIGNDRWAVSARGFNGRFANKLQVLKDGRSLYSPSFQESFGKSRIRCSKISNASRSSGDPTRQAGDQMPSMEPSTSSRARRGTPRAAWSQCLPGAMTEAMGSPATAPLLAKAATSAFLARP